MSDDGLDSPGSASAAAEPVPAPAAAAPEPVPAAGDQEKTSADRLVVLSDGVVAIALTLLILGIQVPSPDGLRDANSISELASALGHTVDGWISYIISFYVIAQFWLVHRQLFGGIRGYRDGLAAWNFLFLLTISVMPFTSDLIGKYPENSLAVVIFSANLILASLARYGMLSFSRRHRLLTPDAGSVLAEYTSLRGIINLFCYALSIPVALLSPDLGKVCWLGLALAPRIDALIAKRRSPQAG
jgi:uncharacterized membrane protein